MLKKTIIFISLIFTLGSCSLFRKESNDELMDIVEQVIKEDRGVSIEIRSISKEPARIENLKK